MTPEERLAKIESILQRTAEQQAQRNQEFARQQEQFTRQQEQFTHQQEQFARQQEQISRLEQDTERRGQEIDKHNEAIRGLIAVGRTCLDSIKELREAQSESEEKLNILVSTVDRIIRRDNPPS